MTIPAHLRRFAWYGPHLEWVKSRYKSGTRANLQGADFRGADLRGADLRGAHLYEADLREANLRGADLRKTCIHEADLEGADLRGADLRGADLRGAHLDAADLREANLRKALLQWADLEGADLRSADLKGANLQGTGLRGANLDGADLRGTVLSPWKRPNGDACCFERDPDAPSLVIGYRTKIQAYMYGPKYEPGKTYRAPIFSACPVTECHPGLYLQPTPKELTGDLIKVWSRVKDIHRVGSRWRTKRFVRVEDFTTRHMRGDMRHGS